MGDMALHTTRISGLLVPHTTGARSPLPQTHTLHKLVNAGRPSEAGTGSASVAKNCNAEESRRPRGRALREAPSPLSSWLLASTSRHP